MKLFRTVIMDVLSIPFNSFIGIRLSDREGFVFMLESNENYLNHIGTVHASALFSLAESTSGQFLLSSFKDWAEGVIPVVRKTEIKFSKPAKGKVYSKASLDEKMKKRVTADLTSKGRSFIPVNIELFDEDENRIFSGTFEWYVQKGVE